MSSQTTIVVNGRRIPAAYGETLVDAALSARVVIPHDCCTGQCSTCRVRVYAGEVDDEGTRVGDTVLACQATVTGEAVIEYDEVPAVVRRAGTITALSRLSPTIVEVIVTLGRKLTILPGQYVKVGFAGHPARDYSPTFRVDGSGELNELVLHIRRDAEGLVSSGLGSRIAIGHRARVKGPFGQAFFRKDEGRIVLVSSGTGWAPIWAVARAARYHQPHREMIVVASARDPADLYMHPSLAWLSATGVTQVTATSSRLATDGAAGDASVRAGRATAHLPRLLPTDTVYVAGAPDMVAAVERLAETIGAACYADAFTPAPRRPFIDARLRRRVRLEAIARHPAANVAAE